jgi:hypothetical protein
MFMMFIMPDMFREMRWSNKVFLQTQYKEHVEAIKTKTLKNMPSMYYIINTYSPIENSTHSHERQI